MIFLLKPAFGMDFPATSDAYRRYTSTAPPAWRPQCPRWWVAWAAPAASRRAAGSGAAASEKGADVDGEELVMVTHTHTHIYIYTHTNNCVVIHYVDVLKWLVYPLSD